MYASTCFSPLYRPTKALFNIVGGHCSLPEEEPPTQLRYVPLTLGSSSLYGSKTLGPLLSDCIDQVLSELVGVKVKEAFYEYMQRNYTVARADIPRNFEKFFMFTEEVCGKGSKTIARCIMKQLWRRLGWSFVDMPDFTISEFLETTQTRIAEEADKNANARLTTGESLSRE